MIEILVLGVPVAKGRPEFNRATGSAHTPKKTRNYEAMLNGMAQEAMAGVPPLEGPLAVDMRLVMPVAKSWPKKRREACLAGAEAPLGKPDWDNLGKVIDALNQIAWVDDSQIVDGRVRKFYGPRPLSLIVFGPCDLVEHHRAHPEAYLAAKPKADALG